MPNPWNGKVVLEAFWWNCWNNKYPNAWYTYLAKLAPRLARMGYDGIWVPQPCKDAGGTSSNGYTPFDYYDLGCKLHFGNVGTRFGTQDEFLRLIAVAHANGLEVYPDIVIDHCGGGEAEPHSPYASDPDPDRLYTLFQPNAFAGARTGRWPRNWYDFHQNPQHWNQTEDWTSSNGGPDFCYQRECSDSGHADPNCATRQNARAWLTWFVNQTGADGFRFDDVKGYPPSVVEDLLYNAMGPGNQYFCVGEFVSGNSSDVDWWAGATLNRSGTFDYPLRFTLRNFIHQGPGFDLGSLPSFQQQNRTKTVPFLNNQDTFRSPNWDSSSATAEDHTGTAYIENPGTTDPGIDPDDPRAPLAYAFLMTIDGSPMLFYEDLFVNHFASRFATTADVIASRPYLENLVWCHQKLAFKSGDYFVRYQAQNLLILERGNRAIVALNSDGDTWHDAWVSTAFLPKTQLHDYSGSYPNDIWTNADGWAYINVPPLSYCVWGPAGITGTFDPAARRTTQQFELDDDLGDSDPATPMYGGKAIPAAWRNAGAIWPAATSQINLWVYSDTPGQQVDILIAPLTLPAQPAVGTPPTASGTTPFQVPFPVAAETRHLLAARLSTAGASPTRLYLKADYLGPATSTAF